MHSRSRSFPVSTAILALTGALTTSLASQGQNTEVETLSPPCGARVTLDFVVDQGAASLRFSGPPGGLVYAVLGTSDAEWLSLPLPLPVPGLPGCMLHASGDVYNAPLLLSAQGTASIPLPPHVAAPPVTVYAQGLLIDLASLRFVGTSNTIGFARVYADTWATLPFSVMADYDNGLLPPVRMTAQELAAFGAAAHQPAESPEAMEAWLRTFVMLDDAQLVAVFEAMQREGFRLAGIERLPEFDLTLQEIAASTRRFVTEARSLLGMPAHVAAIKGTPGIEDIADAAFGNQPSAGCGSISFPWLRSMSYRWPRSGWSVQANLRRAGSGDGCFNYRHNFSDNIVNITPISPGCVSMVGMHGLGWRLYGDGKSLYYRGVWATLAGQNPFSLMGGMKIRR
jgi:hypothetical protein